VCAGVYDSVGSLTSVCFSELRRMTVVYALLRAEYVICNRFSVLTRFSVLAHISFDERQVEPVRVSVSVELLAAYT